MVAVSLAAVTIFQSRRSKRQRWTASPTRSFRDHEIRDWQRPYGTWLLPAEHGDDDDEDDDDDNGDVG